MFLCCFRPKSANYCIYSYVIKREKLAQAAKAGSGSAPVPEPLVGLQRKRTFETTELSEQSDSEPVGSTRDREQRKGALKATQPMRSKRSRLESTVEILDTDDEDAAQVGSSGLGSTDSTPSKPKATRPPPKFRPSSGKPLPKPQWLTPPGEPSNTFKLPTSSLKPNTAPKATANSKQKGSTKTDSSQDPDSVSYQPSYAEIESFEFKLVVSYSKNSTEYHRSTDLESNMKSFWSRLNKQRKEWEDAAGAEWAWELQKAKGRVRGKRSCVASKLAKKPTRWRRGDAGSYACRSCAKNTLLCFTWVEDEDPEHDGDEEEAMIPEPKGEFWCLPVHPEDRRSEVKKDREIRTWLNEEDNGESDSSGEDVGESSEEDEFKVGSDYGDLSKSESSSEEEDDAKESDEDDEL